MDAFWDILSEHLGLAGFGILALLGAWSVSRRRSHATAAKKMLHKAVTARMDEPLTLHPEIDPAVCAGCAACTKVCPEGDILRIIDHKAVLVAPTKCVGHGECERSCPTNAISLVFGTKTRGMDIPRITSNYETNVPGLYIAGELGGMGLIRNAVKQGHLAASHALFNLPPGPGADADLLVVGAGPAGLSAVLTAIEKRKKYICIEQSSFGGTVYNFPRQKIVMTYPAELPGVGPMKFPGNRVSKEELLGLWSELRRRKRIEIREGVKFESLEKAGGLFAVATSKGVIRAKKVILCTGVRGTPRKLGLPNEDSPKVTYNLIDPEQYQDQDVAVVGGGNAAVEAAQQLGRAQLRNRVTLLVRGEAFDRCNDDNRILIEKMAEQGLVKILFHSSVQEIHPELLMVKTGEELATLANDYLFIFAGAEMPQKFLMSLGVKIEKKFGTKL